MPPEVQPRDTPIPMPTVTPLPTPITDLAPSFADTTLKEFEVLVQDNALLGTAGKLISAKLRNDHDLTRYFSLTCGYTFTPKTHAQYQQMIIIQPLDFKMDPLEWVTVSPITVCIQPQKEVPPRGEAYTFGPIAEGNIKKLADCSCKKTISSDDTITLLTQQISYWMVASGKKSGDVLKMSDEQFIKLLSGKGIDQETINTYKDYVPLIRLNVVTTLATCGL
jgi:hypothetical protein